MLTADRVAILLDGEFVKKVLKRRLRRAPAAVDVMAEVGRIAQHESLAGLRLYRVFCYTADPLQGVVKHPLTSATVDFSATDVYAQNSRLVEEIEHHPDVAVRRGTLVHFPAMKFARREGLRVFLDTLGSSQVRQELRCHSDRVL